MSGRIYESPPGGLGTGSQFTIVRDPCPHSLEQNERNKIKILLRSEHRYAIIVSKETLSGPAALPVLWGPGLLTPLIQFQVLGLNEPVDGRPDLNGGE